MIVRGIVVLALLMLLASCVGQPPVQQREFDLDPLLAFTKPADCEAGPTLQHLFKTLLRDTTEEPVTVGPVEVPPSFRAAIGKPSLVRRGDDYTATLPLHGTWMGLPVESVSTRAYKGGDGGGFFLTVRASRADLLAALNCHGFAAPASGERHASPPEEGEWWAMSVTSSGTRSSLHCSLYD